MCTSAASRVARLPCPFPCSLSTNDDPASLCIFPPTRMYHHHHQRHGHGQTSAPAPPSETSNSNAASTPVPFSPFSSAFSINSDSNITTTSDGPPSSPLSPRSLMFGTDCFLRAPACLQRAQTSVHSQQYFAPSVNSNTDL